MIMRVPKTRKRSYRIAASFVLVIFLPFCLLDPTTLSVNGNHYFFETADPAFTIGIKTVGRGFETKRQVESIRRYYPLHPVLIVDDGRNDESDLYNLSGVKYNYIGYDKGLSFGRNTLVSLTKTKYIVLMDDDMIWNAKFDVNTAIRRMKSSKRHILTISLPDRDPYMGHLFEESLNSTVHLCLFSDKMVAEYRVPGIPSCFISDIGLNTIVAETDFLRRHPWPNELKVGEHEAFYLSLKRSHHDVLVCLDMSVDHKPNHTAYPGYADLRWRAAYFQKLALGSLHVHTFYDKTCELLRAQVSEGRKQRGVLELSA